MPEERDFDELAEQLRYVADEGHETAQRILRDVDDYIEDADPSSERHVSLRQQLSDAVYHFEAEHPRLTAAIQKVVDSLTAGGI